MTTYKKLFEPITVKNVTFKNRFIMPPMATRFASFNGMVTDQMINYYTRRAEGGVGLVTLEACSVLYEGMGWRNNVAIFDDVYYNNQRLRNTHSLLPIGGHQTKRRCTR